MDTMSFFHLKPSLSSFKHHVKEQGRTALWIASRCNQIFRRFCAICLINEWRIFCRRAGILGTDYVIFYFTKSP